MAHEDLRFQEGSGLGAASHFSGAILIREQGGQWPGLDRLGDCKTECRAPRLGCGPCCLRLG